MVLRQNQNIQRFLTLSLATLEDEYCKRSNYGKEVSCND